METDNKKTKKALSGQLEKDLARPLKQEGIIVIDKNVLEAKKTEIRQMTPDQWDETMEQLFNLLPEEESKQFQAKYNLLSGENEKRGFAEKMIPLIVVVESLARQKKRCDVDTYELHVDARQFEVGQSIKLSTGGIGEIVADAVTERTKLSGRYVPVVTMLSCQPVKMARSVDLARGLRSIIDAGSLTQVLTEQYSTQAVQNFDHLERAENELQHIIEDLPSTVEIDNIVVALEREVNGHPASETSNIKRVKVLRSIHSFLSSSRQSDALKKGLCKKTDDDSEREAVGLAQSANPHFGGLSGDVASITTTVNRKFYTGLEANDIDLKAISEVIYILTKIKLMRISAERMIAELREGKEKATRLVISWNQLPAETRAGELAKNIAARREFDMYQFTHQRSQKAMNNRAELEKRAVIYKQVLQQTKAEVK